MTRATSMLDEFTRGPRIAYFSMEIALRNEIPTYSGGLGVLAGDTMRSGTDLELPLVGVSLVSRAGYFRQEIEQAVLPLYYRDRPGWIAVMKHTIGKNASFFNSHRMMCHYTTQGYMR